MNKLATISNSVTMTSLELVDYINADRKERGDNTELVHSDFLKKIQAVIKDAGKFSSIYLDSMNREKPCYNFPKREACLMAMSYSYELQAKVFDKMTELESKEVRQLSPMEMVVMSAQAIMRIEQKQAEQDKRMDIIEAKNNAAKDQHEFFSVLGYANLRGAKIDIKTAAHFGRLAATQSKKLGVMTGTCPDPRFGSVGTYHMDILDTVFGDNF